MAEIRMTIKILVDDNLWDLTEPDTKDWLLNGILIGDGSLILHSNELGDEVGVATEVSSIEFITK